MTDENAVKLLRAIRDHAGLTLGEIRDAGTHGADSGYGGFTYTIDGANFTRANRDLVWEILRDDAAEFDMNVGEFLGGFNRADMLDDPDSFDCLLAWYALETAGRWLDDRREVRA